VRRSAGPDQLKAILLTFVIFGHTFVQLQSQDLGKWLIYGFHMPAFLFLSGYLLDATRLGGRPLGALVAHYWRRMLAAWLAVSVVYLAVYERQAFDTVPHAITLLFLTPVFHLWYVPALFGAILLTRLLAGRSAGRVTLVVIAALGMLVFETPLYQRIVPAFVTTHLDARYFGYFGWFLLGFALRNGWLRMPALGWRLGAVVVGGAGWVAGFYGHAWVGDLGFIVLNVGATLCVPALLDRLARPLPVVGDALVRIGRYSLWVYLLHPFVTGQLQLSTDHPLVEQRLAGLLVTALVLVSAAALTWPLARRGATRPVPAASTTD
jgi:acyltransferase